MTRPLELAEEVERPPGDDRRVPEPRPDGIERADEAALPRALVGLPEIERLTVRGREPRQDDPDVADRDPPRGERREERARRAEQLSVEGGRAREGACRRVPLEVRVAQRDAERAGPDPQLARRLRRALDEVVQHARHLVAVVRRLVEARLARDLARHLAWRDGARVAPPRAVVQRVPARAEHADEVRE